MIPQPEIDYLDKETLITITDKKNYLKDLVALKSLIDDESPLNYNMSLNGDFIYFVPGISSFADNYFQVQFREGKLNNLLKEILRQPNIQSHEAQIGKIVSELATLNFTNAVIEYSFTDSLIFKLGFKNNIILIINVPVENMELQDDLQGVFTLLENREVIVNNYNTIENIVEGMHSFLGE